MSDLSQTQSVFYDRLLLALLEEAADLEFSRRIDGQCPGQCAHEQAPADALVDMLRAASLQARAVVIDGLLRVGSLILASRDDPRFFSTPV
jgi:hypothetical protein